MPLQHMAAQQSIGSAARWVDKSEVRPVVNSPMDSGRMPTSSPCAGPTSRKRQTTVDAVALGFPNGPGPPRTRNVHLLGQAQ